MSKTLTDQAAPCTVDVVDLDGTLCRCNTFHLWAKSCLLRPNRALGIRWLVACPLAIGLIAMRAVRIVSHQTLKKWLLVIWMRFALQPSPAAADRVTQDFVHQSFQRHANQGVIERLRANSARRKLLATAAPELYAKYFAALIQADCLGSSLPRRKDGLSWEFCELIRSRKQQSVRQWVGDCRFRFFTDHHDDLPTIQLATQVIAVNPTEKLLAELAAQDIDFELIS